MLSALIVVAALQAAPAVTQAPASPSQGADRAAGVLDLHKRICLANPADPAAQRAALDREGFKPAKAEGGKAIFEAGSGAPGALVSLSADDELVECRVFSLVPGEAVAVFERALALSTELRGGKIEPDRLVAGRTLQVSGQEVYAWFDVTPGRRFPMLRAMTAWAPPQTGPDPADEIVAAVRPTGPAAPRSARSRRLETRLPRTAELITLYRQVCLAEPADAAAQRAAIDAAGLVETTTEGGWRYFKPGPERPKVHAALKLTDSRVECQVFARTRGDESAVSGAAAFEDALSLEHEFYLSTITHDWLMTGLNLKRDGHKLEVGYKAEKRKRFPMVELRTEWHRKGQ